MVKIIKTVTNISKLSPKSNINIDVANYILSKLEKMNVIYNQSFQAPRGSNKSEVHTSFKGQIEYFIMFCLKLPR